MCSFLEYVPGTSPLHRMNPVAKLAAAAAFALACFCSSNLAFLAVLLAAGFALAATCGMVRPAIGLAKAVFAFSLILAVVQVLTTPSGAVLVELPWGYVGTGSLLAALTTVVRLVAAAIPLFLVFYVTKMNDITNAVDPEKRCRVAERPALRRAHVHPRRHPHDRLRHPLRRRSRIRRHHGRFRSLGAHQHHRLVLRVQGHR